MTLPVLFLLVIGLLIVLVALLYEYNHPKKWDDKHDAINEKKPLLHP